MAWLTLWVCSFETDLNPQEHCHATAVCHEALTRLGPYIKGSGTATPYADHNSPLAMFIIAKGMYSDAELRVANTSASTLRGAV
jgi:hypothetical protein